MYHTDQVNGLNPSGAWAPKKTVPEKTAHRYLQISREGILLPIHFYDPQDTADTQGAKGERVVHEKLYRMDYIRMEDEIQKTQTDAGHDAASGSQQVSADSDGQHG